MRTLALRLQKTITDFMDQRGALWLRVTCSEPEAPIVFKLLLDLERKNRGDVFLLFSAPFVNPEQYAQEIGRLFFAECRALDSALAAHHGPPLEKLPERFQGSPGQQLAVLLRAARELLPEDGDQRLIVAFWPLELAAPQAYEQLLDSLFPLTGDAATDCGAGALPWWLRRVRLIGRAAQDPSVLHHPCAVTPYLQRTESDFSPRALQRCMQEIVDDPRSPKGIRMHTLVMLAALHEAHGDCEAARAKYEQAIAYFQTQPSPIMQTVALIQLGALYQRRQQLSAARDCYEHALASAATGISPIIVAILAKNLGEIAFSQQRYDDAAAAYEAWYRLASKLEDRAGAAQAQAQLALLQRRQGVAAANPRPSRPAEAVR